MINKIKIILGLTITIALTGFSENAAASGWSGGCQGSDYVSVYVDPVTGAVSYFISHNDWRCRGFEDPK